jgi:hypothetical protein
LQQAWNGGVAALSSSARQVASLPGRALDRYDQLSNAYPKTKLALDVLPGTNVATSALDVASDLHKGDIAAAAGDAIGLLPGYKLLKAPMHTPIQRGLAKLSRNAPTLDTAINAIPEYAQKVYGQQQPPGYADGGLIQGPGTGTSDSIPATIDGQQPAQVSDGEYLVPANVVQAIGQDFFEHLVQQLHTPVPGEPGPVADVDPVGMNGGDFVVPADVVAQLGRDYFDKLVQDYGA